MKKNVFKKQERRADVLRCQGATHWTSGTNREPTEAALQYWKGRCHHEHTAKELAIAELVETKCSAQLHGLQNQGFFFVFASDQSQGFT